MKVAKYIAKPIKDESGQIIDYKLGPMTQGLAPRGCHVLYGERFEFAKAAKSGKEWIIVEDVDKKNAMDQKKSDKMTRVTALKAVKKGSLKGMTAAQRTELLEKLILELMGE